MNTWPFPQILPGGARAGAGSGDTDTAGAAAFGGVGGSAGPHGARGWSRASLIVALAWGTAVVVMFLGALGGGGFFRTQWPAWALIALPSLVALALAPRWPALGLILPPLGALVQAGSALPPLLGSGGDIACMTLAGLAVALSVTLAPSARWAGWGAVAALLLAGSRLLESAGTRWVEFSEQITYPDPETGRWITETVTSSSIDPTSPRLLSLTTPDGAQVSEFLGLLIAFGLAVPAAMLVRAWARRTGSLNLWQVAPDARHRAYLGWVGVVFLAFAGTWWLAATAGHEPAPTLLSVALGALPVFAAAALLPRFPRAIAATLAGVLAIVALTGFLGPLWDGFFDSYPATGFAWFALLVTVFLAACFLPKDRTGLLLGTALVGAGALWYAGVFTSGVGIVLQFVYPGLNFGYWGGDVVVIGLLKGFIAGGFYLAVAALLGWALRTWAAFRAQASRLQAAREELADSEARRALADERRGIAGDVHDVLAHSLTVIVAQGEGALVTAGEAKQEALRRIVDVARASLRDVRSLIERLDGEDSASPSPGLADLPGLLQNVRDAGLRLSVDEFGERDVLGDSGELALFRILQEGLTNVLTHGGRDASARLTLDWRGDAPGVSVMLSSSSDTDAPGRPGNGLGLEGMRTRAAVAGGWLTAGPDDAPEAEDAATHDGGPGAPSASATAGGGPGTEGERPTSGTDAAPARWLVTAHLPAVTEAAEVLR